MTDQTDGQTPPVQTADAKATAEAQVAANAKAKAAARPAAQKQRRRRLDTAKLDYLARTIDQMNVTGHRLGLQDELIDLHGLKVDQDEDSGAVRLAMAGIEIEPAESMEMALTNWANAARRAIAETIG